MTPLLLLLSCALSAPAHHHRPALTAPPPTRAPPRAPTAVRESARTGAFVSTTTQLVGQVRVCARSVHHGSVALRAHLVAGATGPAWTLAPKSIETHCAPFAAVKPGMVVEFVLDGPLAARLQVDLTIEGTDQ